MHKVKVYCNRRRLAKKGPLKMRRIAEQHGKGHEYRKDKIEVVLAGLQGLAVQAGMVRVIPGFSV